MCVAVGRDENIKMQANETGWTETEHDMKSPRQTAAAACCAASASLVERLRALELLIGQREAAISRLEAAVSKSFPTKVTTRNVLFSQDVHESLTPKTPWKPTPEHQAVENAVYEAQRRAANRAATESGGFGWTWLPTAPARASAGPHARESEVKGHEGSDWEDEASYAEPLQHTQWEGVGGEYTRNRKHDDGEVARWRTLRDDEDFRDDSNNENQSSGATQTRVAVCAKARTGRASASSAENHPGQENSDDEWEEDSTSAPAELGADRSESLPDERNPTGAGGGEGKQALFDYTDAADDAAELLDGPEMHGRDLNEADIATDPGRSTPERRDTKEERDANGAQQGTACQKGSQEDRGCHITLAQSLQTSLHAEATPLKPMPAVAMSRGGWQCAARCVQCKRPLHLARNMQETAANMQLRGILCRACIRSSTDDEDFAERVRLNVLCWAQSGHPVAGYGGARVR